MVAAAPIPSDEEARLESLYSYDILGTPPDDRFDLFTRVSTWLFESPLAAINLIDKDHTFFKSLIGFPAYAPARSTSICAHAVGGDAATMVIEDLSRDSRFHDHPLVAKGMLFYASTVLLSSTGHRLGTLCIGDAKPRLFSGNALQKLVELGNGVGAVLELHRSSLWLLRAANEDKLTGLCNRRLFTDRLHSSLDGAHPGRSRILIYLDLDGFKPVNDLLGHDAGDAVLREVARRLNRMVRSGDTVARLGGDEFAILMAETATIENAEALAQRVLAAFNEPYDYEGQTISIGTSIGIATGSHDANSLMRSADGAMYRAKRAGRGRYFIDPATTLYLGGVRDPAAMVS
jgi:diguanylate cyclase